MKRHLIAVLAASLAFASTVYPVSVNFDYPADSSLFNVIISFGNSSSSASYTADGGFDGSGAIQMNSSFDGQSWVLNEGITFASGQDYTVSAFIKANTYCGIGFTNSANPDGNIIYPEHSILFGVNSDSQYIDLNSTADSSGSDLGYWDNSTLLNTVPSPAAYSNGDWLLLTLTVNYDGSDFLATYSAFQLNGDGSAGDAILAGTQIFANSGLASDSSLHAFFYFDSSGSPTLDNFTAVPEPSTLAAFAGLAALGFGIVRRRRS